MALQKGEFIEILFTGRVKGGEVFDSNIKEELEEANLNNTAKPFIFPLGEEMFVKGVDEFLIGKDLGEYNVELKPEDAFGKRDPKLIQMITTKAFIQNKVNPIPGAMFNFDGRIAKILTVSGGRVMIDFNNPIAGKEVEYKVIVKRKVEDKKEQISALNDFFFRRDFEAEIKEGKIILQIPKGMKQFVELFKEKYKELLGLELETIEVEDKKPKSEDTKE
jgi:FKBP-type peptidyl-prolyl cis-trans isomerase 2